MPVKLPLHTTDTGKVSRWKKWNILEGGSNLKSAVHLNENSWMELKNKIECTLSRKPNV